MPVIRLAVAALLLCSPLAFGQNEQGHAYTNVFAPPYSYSDFESLRNFNRSATVPSEPSWIAHEKPQNAFQEKIGSLSVTPDDALPVANSRQNSKILITTVSPGGETPRIESGDTVCYSIRSYVVARDDKDSDSTHPVSSSTCQPANRYSLRSTDLRPGSQDR